MAAVSRISVTRRPPISPDFFTGPIYPAHGPFASRYLTAVYIFSTERDLRCKQFLNRFEKLRRIDRFDEDAVDEPRRGGQVQIVLSGHEDDFKPRAIEFS